MFWYHLLCLLVSNVTQKGINGLQENIIEGFGVIQ